MESEVAAFMADMSIGNGSPGFASSTSFSPTKAPHAAVADLLAASGSSSSFSSSSAADAAGADAAGAGAADEVGLRGATEWFLNSVSTDDYHPVHASEYFIPRPAPPAPTPTPAPTDEYIPRPAPSGKMAKMLAQSSSSPSPRPRAATAESPAPSYQLSESFVDALAGVLSKVPGGNTLLREPLLAVINDEVESLVGRLVDRVLSDSAAASQRALADVQRRAGEDAARAQEQITKLTRELETTRQQLEQEKEEIDQARGLMKSFGEQMISLGKRKRI
jgi:hypothetical protein